MNLWYIIENSLMFELILIENNRISWKIEKMLEAISLVNKVARVTTSTLRNNIEAEIHAKEIQTSFFSHDERSFNDFGSLSDAKRRKRQIRNSHKK